jgi:hypothetical protein
MSFNKNIFALFISGLKQLRSGLASLKTKFVYTVKRSIKWLVPHGLYTHFKAKEEAREEKRREENEKIRTYFLSLNRDEQDAEVLEIIHYFENNPFTVFPYDYTKNYNPEKIKVFVDPSCQMKYVLHDNKRLYFPKHYNFASIRNTYDYLLHIEQDKDSPHRYETPDYTVKKGDIIADIGTAEGIWALTYAEIAGKIYLFECDPMWIKALEKTFEPWKEKVFIINKYVSNVSKGVNITLDDFIRDGKINFIKADIEGAEIQLLEGAKKVLSTQNDLKLLLCAYHRKEDAVRLKEYLEHENFSTEYSKGYMLFIYGEEKLDYPYIRRGLIRATKKADTENIPRTGATAKESS